MSDFFVFFFDFNLLVFFSFLSFWYDWFNNFNVFLLVFIIFFVLFFFTFFFLFTSFFSLNLSYGLVEFWMCFLPLFFLVLQVFPSVFLLFFLNFSDFCSNLTIKVTAHQWYWSYELGEGLSFFFDSFMQNNDSFSLGDYRLLEVDNRLVLPSDSFIRFVLTSFDVIHSWTMPAFFLKMDVMSGLLNIIDFFFEATGVFYGQCSEICGANHSFMPVVIELVPFAFFDFFFLSF